MQKVIVQLYPNYLSASFDTLCEGDLFNNIPIYTDTILSLHLNTIYGCDSIINRKIKVNKKSNSIQNIEICRFSSFNGVTINKDTLIKKVFLNRGNCDSVVSYIINVKDTVHVLLDTSICTGDIFLGKYLKNDTTIQLINKNANNCDSITIYHVLVKRLKEAIVNASVCRGVQYVLPNGKHVNQTGIYKDTTTNNIGCDSVIITNLSVQDPIPVIQSISICDGQSYILPNGGKVKTAGIYIDTLRNTNICDSVVITNLSIFPNTLIVQLKPNDTLDIGNSLELKPISNADSIINWTWTPIENLSCSNCKNPLANPIQNTVYILTAKAENGCEDTAMTNIVIHNSDIYIPSAFSPNNDGINDELTIFVTNPVSFDLKIFNRWGQVIFESTSVHDKWDGIYLGESVPVDSYVYILDVILPNGKEYKKQGTITLLK